MLAGATSYIRLFCLPKSMEVAVFINCNNLLIFAESELSLWLHARLQIALIAAAICLYCNPADIMCVHHRMDGGPDSHLNLAAILLYNRYMLFKGTISRARAQYLHFLATAMRYNALIIHEH